MQRDISKPGTTGHWQARSNDFHRYLVRHRLIWEVVARASEVPVLTVWSIDHGLIVGSRQAALVRGGLQKLTGEPFTGVILTDGSEGKQS